MAAAGSASWGAIADSALTAGGKVIGVIPEKLVNTEVAHRGLTQLHEVPDMHARKALFTSLSDGFVTLPGGVGTMDELWEAVSWAQLGYHAKPVGLLNAGGFYDRLLDFNRHMIDVGFIRPAHAGILIARDTLPELIDAMEAYQPHTPITSIPVERCDGKATVRPLTVTPNSFRVHLAIARAKPPGNGC